MFQVTCVIGLALTVVAVMAHYAVFGPRHRGVDSRPRQVRRFNAWAIGVHALLGLSLLALASTGAVAVASGLPLRGWPLFAHCMAAPLFAVALTLKALTWAGAFAFGAHDRAWLAHLGGYFGGRQDLPAGRFNAGQKAFFWAIVALGLTAILSGLGRMAPVLGSEGQAALYYMHRSSALLVVMAFLVHVYLATFANPGTWTAMVSGRVSAAWAERHHPLWWRRLEKAKGEHSDE